MAVTETGFKPNTIDGWIRPKGQLGFGEKIRADWPHRVIAKSGVYNGKPVQEGFENLLTCISPLSSCAECKASGAAKAVGCYKAKED
jgi:hypothetical protein